MWHEIPGVPGFEITKSGRVRSWWSTTTKTAVKLDTPRELNPHTSNTGYVMFSVRLKGGIPRAVALHRLLLATFVRPPEPGDVGRHLNGRKDDNQLSNLAWGSAKDDQDEVRLGNRPEGKHLRSIKASVRAQIRKEKAVLARALAKKHGCSLSSIYRVWKEGGGSG